MIMSDGDDGGDGSDGNNGSDHGNDGEATNDVKALRVDIWISHRGHAGAKLFPLEGPSLDSSINRAF